jgi:hypothetical protein
MLSFFQGIITSASKDETKKFRLCEQDRGIRWQMTSTASRGFEESLHQGGRACVDEDESIAEF